MATSGGSMNLLKLLVVIAFMVPMGTARAVTADQTFSPGALSPTAEVRTASYSAASITMPYSFMNISNFTVGASNRTAIADAVGYVPEGITAEPMHDSDLTLMLFSGSNSGGSVLGAVSSSNGSPIEVPAALVSHDYSARVWGTAGGLRGGGVPISSSTLPEPDGWTTLLCGLVIVGFMARRKTDLLAG
jgi:hypothetical protein